MAYHDEVADVYQRISPYIKKTPTLVSSYFSQQTGSTILLKCENFQYTHSFKVRGVFSKVTQLKDKSKKLITTSGGNHGLAVAFAAKKFGLQALIVVPDFVPQFRIDMIKAFGAEVVVDGNTMEGLNNKVAELNKNNDYIYVHPFDDDEVIAGQGTIAYELLQEFPDVEVIVASVGGGGLISGISQYAKSFNPNILIYGVQTAGADAMSKSLAAGHVVSIPTITSIATSLGVTKVAERTFAIVKKNVSKLVTTSDAETIHELLALLDKDKLLVEPASACTLAAMLSGKLPNLKGKKIAVILCGGNFSLAQLKTYL